MKYLSSNRLKLFAPYQDAIEQDRVVLYHTVLSPALNMGLLTPYDILKYLTVEDEALLRQICGWREYVVSCYKHKKSIPRSWYEGTTLHPIFNNELRKTRVYSYAHHIPMSVHSVCI